MMGTSRNIGKGNDISNLAPCTAIIGLSIAGKRPGAGTFEPPGAGGFCHMVEPGRKAKDGKR
jgi:hypothetical protein